MDERRRRIDRFIVVGAVTAVLVGFALLSDGFTEFSNRTAVSQGDDPIVSTTEP
jgi:hypothetical protein